MPLRRGKGKSLPFLCKLQSKHPPLRCLSPNKSFLINDILGINLALRLHLQWRARGSAFAH